MAQPLFLQNNFSLGMKQDIARNRMPNNSLWNAVDVILNYGAPLRQRSGWTAHCTLGGYTSVKAGIYAVFSSTAGSVEKNIAIANNYFWIDATNPGSGVAIGGGYSAVQNPVFHGGTRLSGTTTFNGLVIAPNGAGTTAPAVYNGTTLRTLDSSAPTGRYAAVYKDYTLLANGNVGGTYYPNRVWFSNPGDPDCAEGVAWDTTDSWIDFSLPVIGFGPTKNACLVFHKNQISRIRGSIPPPEQDMVVDDPMFQIGLLDTFSITPYKENIYWCAPEGVFRSDGVVIDDLTKKGGMLRYWLDVVNDATDSWTFATGVQRDTLFIAVMNGTTSIDAFMVDLQSLAWTRLSNIDATSFWSGMYAKSDELYWGRATAANVVRMSTIYNVGIAANKLDGNGYFFEPTVETPFFELGRPGLKRLRRSFIGADVHDYLTDNPYVTVEYITSPEATSYTNVGNITESTEYQRAKLPINDRGPGIAFKLHRVNAGDFLLHDFGIEAIKQEESK